MSGNIWLQLKMSRIAEIEDDDAKEKGNNILGLSNADKRLLGGEIGEGYNVRRKKMRGKTSNWNRMLQPTPRLTRL